jgi:hypothetical protein
MRPRRRRPEDAIQRAICQHLEARAAPGLVWFHVPQGNKLGGKISANGIAIQGAINRGLGVKRGVSDLIFLHNAKFFALEVKADGRTPTEEQLEFIDRVNAAGCDMVRRARTCARVPRNVGPIAGHVAS